MIKLNSIKKLMVLHRLIFDLTRNDLKNRYFGSYLGVLWAFIQPTISILIYWFVFQVGFKSTPIDNFPFILWLASAMIAWNFFADCVQSSTNAIIENSYLVKKVVFRISILPFVKLYSAFIIHLFFIILVSLMFIVYKHPLNFHVLQISYYLLCTICLTLGISWLTSSLGIFLKDVNQIIAMLLQFGFWLTPIFYSLNIIPGKIQFLYNYNPVYYITEGYRNSFIYSKWFWEDPKQTLIFWVMTFIIMIIGATVFKKLKPHFADVL
ncbi:ABC transporter permease [Paenibacillus psychroresistens]|nr:ABC transporter permease [Paenibacillus psychroresistens]